MEQGTEVCSKNHSVGRCCWLWRASGTWNKPPSPVPYSGLFLAAGKPGTQRAGSTFWSRTRTGSLPSRSRPRRTSARKAFGPSRTDTPMSLRFASTCRDTASRTGCATCHCTLWVTHRCGTNDADTQQRSNAPILCRALHPTLSECLAEYPSSATVSTALSSIPRLRGSRGYFGA